MEPSLVYPESAMIWKSPSSLTIYGDQEEWETYVSVEHVKERWQVEGETCPDVFNL
jgi:hypothetical protein